MVFEKVEVTPSHKTSRRILQEGYQVVVDCDLKSYFDTIHHQRDKGISGIFHLRQNSTSSDLEIPTLGHS